MSAAASGCHCTVYQVRDTTTGQLRDARDCVCPNTHLMSGDSLGDFHRRNAKEKETMTTRTDSTDEATQIASIENARKARDSRLAVLGQRLDAKDAAAKARVRAHRDRLRREVDPSTKDRDVREILAMHDGDESVLEHQGSTFRDLQIVRASRAERERHAAVMSAAMPATSSGANLDADDGEAPIVIPADDPVVRARAERDARALAAGRRGSR